jgi:hypothetical protein
MKIRNILTGTIALASLITAAQADVEIRVTGATAFRAAATKAIYDKFVAGGSFTFAHDVAANATPGLAVQGANRATFKGTFPGIPGVTTVRCSWNGSVEGIRAVALGGSFNPLFIQDAALASPGTDLNEAANENALKTGDTLAQLAKFSFSDVRQTSTPIASPVLNPSDASVGITTFALIANEGAPAGFTNITSQQFKALFGSGKLPLSVFTGSPADTKNVYASGRNDGSGTRTTYMAESGLGITTQVVQYVATSSTGTAISVIRKAPSTATLGAGTFASTLWGQDIDGNGGYVSGSALRTDFGKTSASVQVLDADGSELEPAGTDLLLATFLTTSDARNAASNGGKILGWNGHGLTSLQTSSTLSIADRDAIAQGKYTAWSVQQLYYSGSLSADETTFDTAVRTGIPAGLLPSRLNGIPSSEMAVFRSDDGAPVGP